MRLGKGDLVKRSPGKFGLLAPSQPELPPTPVCFKRLKNLTSNNHKVPVLKLWKLPRFFPFLQQQKTLAEFHRNHHWRSCKTVSLIYAAVKIPIYCFSEN